jgi:hypothetical protein
MSYLRTVLCGAGMCLLLVRPAGARAEATNEAPDFKEVYELLRAHLAGETPADLDQAAVQGLIAQLHAKVSLAPAASDTNADSAAAVVAKPVLYDSGIGYLRVSRVGEGLEGLIKDACAQLTNSPLKALILDLRFAGGRDYAAVAPAADLFVAKETPLLDWGEGMARSKAKTDALTLPMAVLVNQLTAAAAEALAAVLREADGALLLGANTAGEATMDQDFILKNGQHLRIATSEIKLGSGETLTSKGVTPDIKVAVSAADEMSYFADPFKDIPRSLNLVAGLGPPPKSLNENTATNPPTRSARPTEADLIRERKERPGMELEYSVAASREAEPEKPYIRDPVLGRALDLLKGILVLRSAHAP